MNKPDFYLASSEGYGMEEPRCCFAVRRLRGDSRDDYLLVRIEPPVIGQGFNLGNQDIHYLILATRHIGKSLFPIQHWPVFVHVARSLIPLEGRDVIHDNEMESIAWAELYETEEKASAKIL